MKVVNKEARFDLEKCTGCRTCANVCPAAVIEMRENRPYVAPNQCFGCNACVESCPQYCITTVPLEEKRVVYFDPSGYDKEQIEQLCVKAHFWPKMKICCGGTKAEEVAAAILAGAKTPVDLVRMTGIRTNCKSGCVQPIFRMLKAAGLDGGAPPGYQWYDMTETIWEIDPEVKAQFGEKYHFDEDIGFLDRCIEKGKALE